MKNNSAKNRLSRSHLETLTSSQLIELADEYGIDIPDDLNRRFIIVELLEVAKEIDENLNYKETIKETDEAANIASELPEGYNETKIDILLRNPVSIFVYWDYSETLYKQLVSSKTPVHLQVCFFDDLETEKPEETFDIQINYSDREQYILIPGGKKYVRVDLVQDDASALNSVLAVSSRIAIPQGSHQFMSLQPGQDAKIKPILELSGLKTILKNHYNNYRESFN
ncbi:MAG: DUF4912 domain-containing protein [Treponema sp.]|uniref:DUF4912 domain-containing protein n=1 Tax=Treponema sp. TaxID=166 RepID=UPI001B542C46|nr:DUF4912 domain-containing protein [uncultured Treponema sp.]MBP5587383.1 DUF4912 domain-containing protein [Treponema sp.]MBR0155342.1 DUF4912 domain-containing protein [Treponema sp.]